MPSQFAGRDTELRVLQDAFERVASGSGPELAVVLGESGLGKTRLAHELYGWLATAARASERAYWPTEIGTDTGKVLLVNPPLDQVDDDEDMIFMWWGVRLDDPLGRNQSLTSAVSTYVPVLETHAISMERAGRMWHQLRNVTFKGLAGLAAIIPGLGNVVGAATAIGDVTWALEQLRREARDDRRSFADTAERVRDDLNERIVTLLSTLLRTTRERTGVPTILLIDDAQFSPADPGLVTLFERILREAWLSSWPLLLVVTHWSREWHQQWNDEQTPTIAGAIRHLHVPRAPTWEPLRLDALNPDALRPVLHDALPGLTTDQATALLERAGGHPLFLEEIIRTARQPPRHFRDRDPNQALTDEGLGAILAIGTRIVDFTHERLATAPPEVRELVCLSSLQGTRLLQRINRRLAQRLADTLHEAERVGDDHTLESAERPYAFLQRTSPTVAAFAQRIFYDVARDSAHDHFDVDDALTELRTVLHESYRQGPEAHGPDEWPLLAKTTALLLEDSPEPDQRVTAARALAYQARRAGERYEPMLAARHAERILAGANRGAWAWADLGFDAAELTCTVFLRVHRFVEALEVARALAGLAGDDAQSAAALQALGDALHGTGDLREAGDAWRVALRHRRALASTEASDTNDRNLAAAADRLGRWEQTHGNLEAASRHFDEANALAEGLRERLSASRRPRANGTSA